MKIAIISSGFLPLVDGVTVSLYERLKRLSTWGHEVIVFAPDYEPLSHLYPNWQAFTGHIFPNVTVVSLPSQPLFWGLVSDDQNVRPATQRLIEQMLAQFQPDIIHVDEPERLFTGGLYLPGRRFAQQLGIPCISFYRTNFIDYLEDYIALPSWAANIFKSLAKKLVSWVYNNYDLTLVASPITHNKLIDYGIRNTYCADLLGIDLQQFTPALRQTNYLTNKYGLTDDERLKITFLGRLRPDKGWPFTINALPKLAAVVDLEQVDFIIAGDGELQSTIKRDFQKYVPHVYPLGHVPPKDVPALLANSDLHITTSTKETRGLTILESLACGTPVLVPNAGGVIQDVQDGWNGLIFQPHNQDDFISKFKCFVENASLRRKLGQHGPNSVAKYNWDNAIRIWLDIVEDLRATKRFTLDGANA